MPEVTKANWPRDSINKDDLGRPETLLNAWIQHQQLHSYLQLCRQLIESCRLPTPQWIRLELPLDRPHKTKQIEVRKLVSKDQPLSWSVAPREEGQSMAQCLQDEAIAWARI
jgi:hypothetical protein